MIDVKEAKKILEATKEAYDKALARCLKNGPTDVEGHQMLSRCAVRYEFTLGMIQAYFTNAEL